jgi:hypothetical protein
MVFDFGLGNLTRVKDAQSRAITPENPEGNVGAGGQTASELGPSRKGRPNISIKNGEITTLADIDGPGVINHVWLTMPAQTEAGDFPLRDIVLRMYWDDEDEPSVEVPLGDFFCNGHAQRCRINSLPIVVAPDGGFNSYFPMPFREHAEITIESEHPGEIGGFYYQFDYELVPKLPDNTAYFHAQWRRENPTARGTDYTIVDGVEGRGHYVGTYLAWTALARHWWGEGEVKIYLDGDDEHPTICGTGTEDYSGGAWGFGDSETYSTPFLGYPLYDNANQRHGGPPRHGIYRWHIPDPIHFREDLRVTVQQIGAGPEGFFERQDDIASVAYWYQQEPHAVFPDLPARRERWPQ